MSGSDDTSNAVMIELTASVVSAYVGHNTVHVPDVPNFIATIHDALRNLRSTQDQRREKLTPRVPVKETITPDFLISLEDGRKYKSLKRHLSGKGLTPQQYREKWGLPVDYPMVAPNYSAQRSEFAKAAGLGRKRRQTQQVVAKRGRSRTPA
jgi:predicted transcriptional regulator